MSMPDWKKPDDYAYTDKLDGPGWAWEFLRRNENFNADYKAFKNGDLKSEDGKSPISFEGTQFKNFGGVFFLEPPLNAGQTVKSWVKEVVLSAQAFKLRTPEQFLAHKWGLEGVVPNPSENALETKVAIKFEDEYPFPKILRFLEDIENIPLEDTSALDNVESGEWPAEFRRDRVILEFTLAEAFQPQVNRIEEKFKRLHKKYRSNPLQFASPPKNKGKPRKNVFLRRLRILDADLQSPDLPDKEKQKEIYGEEETWNNPDTHKRDRKIISEKSNKNGYIEIASIAA